MSNITKAQSILTLLFATLFVITFALALAPNHIEAQETDLPCDSDETLVCPACAVDDAGNPVGDCECTCVDSDGDDSDDNDDDSENDDSDDSDVDNDGKKRPSPFDIDRPDVRPVRTHDATTTDRVELRDARHSDRLVNICERLLERVNRVAERMQAAINRLQHVHNRIESRIEKFEEQHPDTDLSAAKEHLAAAQVLINEAQAALGAWETDADVLLSDCGDGVEGLREKLNEIREGARALKDLIKKAHAELVEAIVDIRASIGSSGQDGVDDDNGDEEDNE